MALQVHITLVKALQVGQLTAATALGAVSAESCGSKWWSKGERTVGPRVEVLRTCGPSVSSPASLCGVVNVQAHRMLHLQVPVHGVGAGARAWRRDQSGGAVADTDEEGALAFVRAPEPLDLCDESKAGLTQYKVGTVRNRLEPFEPCWACCWVS